MKPMSSVAVSTGIASSTAAASENDALLFQGTIRISAN
jgi:hypothetical protein